MFYKQMWSQVQSPGFEVHNFIKNFIKKVLTKRKNGSKI